MDLHGYTIEQDCPECGKVQLTADEFEGASYTKEGRLTTRFECPRCGMHLVAVYELGDDTVTLMTGVALEAIGAKTNGADASAPMSVRPGAHPQTYNPDAAVEPLPESGREVGSENEALSSVPAGKGPDAQDSEHGAPAPQAEPEKPAEKEMKKSPGLTINYLPMSSNRLMTFDIRFDTQPAKEPSAPAQAEPVEYSPSEEDKARLEYFHRQLEGLETVDDAINEIDNGYNLSDGGGEDDDPAR